MSIREDFEFAAKMMREDSERFPLGRPPIIQLVVSPKNYEMYKKLFENDISYKLPENEYKVIPYAD